MRLYISPHCDKACLVTVHPSLLPHCNSMYWAGKAAPLGPELSLQNFVGPNDRDAKCECSGSK